MVQEFKIRYLNQNLKNSGFECSCKQGYEMDDNSKTCIKTCINGQVSDGHGGCKDPNPCASVTCGANAFCAQAMF